MQQQPIGSVSGPVGGITVRIPRNGRCYSGIILLPHKNRSVTRKSHAAVGTRRGGFVRDDARIRAL